MEVVRQIRFDEAERQVFTEAARSATIEFGDPAEDGDDAAVRRTFNSLAMKGTTHDAARLDKARMRMLELAATLGEERNVEHWLGMVADRPMPSVGWRSDQPGDPRGMAEVLAEARALQFEQVKAAVALLTRAGNEARVTETRSAEVTV